VPLQTQRHGWALLLAAVKEEAEISDWPATAVCRCLGLSPSLPRPAGAATLRPFRAIPALVQDGVPLFCRTAELAGPFVFLPSNGDPLDGRRRHHSPRKRAIGVPDDRVNAGTGFFGVSQERTSRLHPAGRAPE